MYREILFINLLDKTFIECPLCARHWGSVKKMGFATDLTEHRVNLERQMFKGEYQQNVKIVNTEEVQRVLETLWGLEGTLWYGPGVPTRPCTCQSRSSNGTNPQMQETQLM